MCSNVKRLCSILLSISVICLILNFYWPTWAQNFEPNSQKGKTATSIENKTNTESPSDLPAKEIEMKPLISLIVSVQNLTSKNYRYCKLIANGPQLLITAIYHHF